MAKVPLISLNCVTSNTAGDGEGIGVGMSEGYGKGGAKGLACMGNYCCQKFLFTGSAPSIIASGDPSLSHHLCSLPSRSLGQNEAPSLGSPREGPGAVCSLLPLLWLGGGGGGLSVQDSCPQRGHRGMRVEACA